MKDHILLSKNNKDIEDFLDIIHMQAFANNEDPSLLFYFYSSKLLSLQNKSKILNQSMITNHERFSVLKSIKKKCIF